ncbi:13029_t:CDS:2, partial [Entrophospora sp. SA101]
QEEININGWAVESRVYAEDPENYLPSIGRLSKYIEPVSLTNKKEVRCDSGIVEGSEISIYYDPLICKLSTYGDTRQEAIDTIKRFRSGNISTKFLAEEFPEGFKGHALNHESLYELASIAALIHAKRDYRNWCWGGGKEALFKGDLTGHAPKKWNLWIKVHADTELEPLYVQIEKKSSTRFPKTNITARWPLESPLVNAHFQQQENQKEKNITVQYLQPLPVGLRLQHVGTKFDITIHNELQHQLIKYMADKPKLDTSKVLLSPMPGSVVSVSVKAGTELAVVEAMKMQNILYAPNSGKIKNVNVKPGDSVAADEIMIEFEDENPDKKQLK